MAESDLSAALYQTTDPPVAGHTFSQGVSCSCSFFQVCSDVGPDVDCTRKLRDCDQFKIFRRAGHVEKTFW